MNDLSLPLNLLDCFEELLDTNIEKIDDSTYLTVPLEKKKRYFYLTRDVNTVNFSHFSQKFNERLFKFLKVLFALNIYYNKIPYSYYTIMFQNLLNKKIPHKNFYYRIENSPSFFDRILLKKQKTEHIMFMKKYLIPYFPTFVENNRFCFELGFNILKESIVNYYSKKIFVGYPLYPTEPLFLLDFLKTTDIVCLLSSLNGKINLDQILKMNNLHNKIKTTLNESSLIEKDYEIYIFSNVLKDNKYLENVFEKDPLVVIYPFDKMSLKLSKKVEKKYSSFLIFQDIASSDLNLSILFVRKN